MLFFFFQAEDGIRDYKVTGVQTCALPISRRSERRPYRPLVRRIGCVASEGMKAPRRDRTSEQPGLAGAGRAGARSEEHTSELQSPCNLVCRLLLEKKKQTTAYFDVWCCRI